MKSYSWIVPNTLVLR